MLAVVICRALRIQLRVRLCVRPRVVMVVSAAAAVAATENILTVC